MIFFEGNRLKIFVLAVLVAFATIGIFWQWFKLEPVRKVDLENDSQFWTVVQTGFDDVWSEVQDQWKLSQWQARDFQEEFTRQTRQELVVKGIKEYLEEQASSTESKVED